jgi:serine O-acetyltransferase
MEYEYTGDVHHELVDAYAEDEPPFPAEDTISFPHQSRQREEVALLERLLFPRCWNAGDLLGNPGRVRELLSDLGGLYYTGVAAYSDREPEEIVALVDGVLAALPAVRVALKKDVEAAYKGDPAAKSYAEIVRSYPGFHAVLVQRVAHTLYERDAAEYARELTEYAKTQTGIDIHPGAEIGEYFFVDHGTGVVIGETATVGDWVRIYQNVTLGALHFEEGEGDDHTLRKGYKRHPDIGDHVVIGAGSNVLGAIDIGDHVSIGANSWVTEDVPEYTSVFISNHPEQTRKRKN